MGSVTDIAGPSHSSLVDLLGTCPMHAEENTPHETLELTGRVERLPAEGRFVVLVPHAENRSVTALELDAADVESCEVLLEDSARRKTCRLVVAAGAIIRKRYTPAELRRELTGDSTDETASMPTGVSDPITAWETAAWRNSSPEQHSRVFAPLGTLSDQPVEPHTPVAAQQAHTPPATQTAYIELYEGQLYYYFPYGTPSTKGWTP